MSDNFSSKSAILLACFTMAAVEGSLKDKIPFIKRIDDENDPSDWDAAMDFWNNNDVVPCMEHSIAHVDSEHKHALIANLVDIASAFGDIEELEQGLLTHYIVQLGADDDMTDKILDVILIKNAVKYL